MTPHRAAQAILQLAVRILPQKRRSWAAAMAAEFHHLPQGHLGFACGCLRSALMTRLPPVAVVATHALLAVIALLCVLQASGIALTASLTDGRPVWWLVWGALWTAPLGLLAWLGWRRPARLAPVAGGCLAVGLAGTLLVIAVPHEPLSRVTGSTPLVLGLCGLFGLAVSRIRPSSSWHVA